MTAQFNDPTDAIRAALEVHKFRDPLRELRATMPDPRTDE